MIFIFYFLTFLNSASAQNKNVIDLGSLDVHGQVRQPPIQFYQQKSVPKTLLKKMAEGSFVEFEKKLLAPLQKKAQPLKRIQK